MRARSVTRSASEAERQHAAAGTRQVARGGLANLAGAAYSGLATFGVTVLLTNIASPEDAGVYFSATSLLLIALSIAQLGIPVGYVYFLARQRALGQSEQIRGTLLAGALPATALTAAVVTVVAVFRQPLASLLLGDDVDDGAAILLTVAVGLIVAITAESALGATRGLGTMRPTVIGDKVVNPTVQLLALLALAVAGWTGGNDLVWTRVLGYLAVAVIAVPWLRRLLRRVPRPESSVPRMPTRATVSRFWAFTGPRAIGQVAQTGIQRVDIVLIALWLGPAEAAIYGAATRFLVFGQLAGHAIGTAVQPRLSALASRNETAALQHIFRTSTAWIILATWPFYLTFLIHADLLLRVFGERYTTGAGVLQVLAVAMLVATGCGVVDAVLLMAGRSVLTMINSWVALAANILLNIWLIPQWGILGAAVAWVAAILATNVVPLIQVRATLGVHPYGRITVRAITVVTVLFGALPALVRWLGGGVIGAALCLLVVGAAYAAVLISWRRALGITDLLNRRRKPASLSHTPEDQP